MRITTKIALGNCLLAALLVGALGYQLRLMHQVQEINRELSAINVEVARTSIRLLHNLELVREFALKHRALEDPDYLEQWRAWEERFTREVHRLGSLELTEEEGKEVRALEVLWTVYLRGAGSEARPEGAGLLPGPASRENDGAPSPGTVSPAIGISPGAGIQLPPLTSAEIDRHVDALRSRIDRLIEVSGTVVADRARESARAGERAELVSWAAAGAALGAAILFSVIFFFSLSGRFRNLVRATGEVARGRFEYRIPTTKDDELTALARSFNQMARQLDELDELKRDFVSHVSHELKAPLAAIQETTSLLLDEIPGRLTGKQRRLLERNHQSSRRLSRMIRNLLDLSRLEAGAMPYDFQESDLTELVRDAREELEPVALEREVQVRVPHPADSFRLPCDGDRMLDVLSNLLGNAVGFSPPGESVEVDLEWRPDLPDSFPPSARNRLPDDAPRYLHLSVRDRGPGVPDDEKERIFEKFHQVRKKGRSRVGGVGLGLAVTRSIVNAHRGAVWVTDRPSGGSAFHVLLPGFQPDDEDPSRTSEGSGARVLSAPAAPSP